MLLDLDSVYEPRKPVEPELDDERRDDEPRRVAG